MFWVFPVSEQQRMIFWVATSLYSSSEAALVAPLLTRSQCLSTDEVMQTEFNWLGLVWTHVAAKLSWSPRFLCQKGTHSVFITFYFLRLPFWEKYVEREGCGRRETVDHPGPLHLNTCISHIHNKLSHWQPTCNCVNGVHGEGAWKRRPAMPLCAR